MRTEIKKIFENYGLLKNVYIGEGADAGLSIVHFDLSKKKNKVKGKEFAVQFEKKSRTLAIWDIKERVDHGDSLNLHVKDSLEWNEIKDLRVYRINIANKNSGRLALVAVMPISNLDMFIQFNKYLEFGFNVEPTNFDEELESVDVIGDATEGRSILVYGRRYERDPKLREKAIQLQGCQCKICGFDFKKRYGTIGEGFIEVHHIKPLCEGEQQPDPSKDLICVCANCHRMIHRKKSVLTPEELKRMIQTTAMEIADTYEEIDLVH